MPIANQIQSDGKIVVLGTTSNVANPNESSFALARYNSDGSLDTTFGTGGTVVFSFGPAGSTSSDVALSMSLSSTGLIGVCGTSNASGTQQFAEAVFNPNGTFDTSFGGTGKVLTGLLGGDAAANDIAFEPNGDIVSVGSATNPSTGQVEFTVVRYLPNGSLDPKFGKAGQVLTSINGSDDEAYGLALGAKGLIVVTGATSISSGASSQPATVEYTATGALNKRFGVGGIATTTTPQPAVGDEVAITAGNGVFIAGGTTPSLSSVDPSNIDINIVQYTATGRPDPTFNGGQPLLLNFGAASPALARVVAPAISSSHAAMGILSHLHGVVAGLGKTFVVDTFKKTGPAAVHPFDANSNTTLTGIAEVVSGGADLTETLQTNLTTVVPDGAKGLATVTVTNSGNQPAVGSVAITLYASLESTIDAGSIQLLTVPNAAIKLKATGSKALKLKFVLPPTLPDGEYFLLAKVDASPAVMNVNAADDVIKAAAPVRVENPFSGLTGAALTTPTGLSAGSRFTLPVTIQNSTGLPDKGTIGLQVLASTDVTPSGSAVTLASTKLKLSLPPGGSRVFPVKLVLPAAGTYYLLVVLTPPPNPNGSASTDILAGTMQLIVK
jgi:uncharacterized delta-60 repeat protein